MKGLLNGKKHLQLCISSTTVRFEFLEKVMKELSEFSEGMTIIGGDFNLVLDPKIDTSSCRSHLSHSTQKRIKTYLHDYEYMAFLRIIHPTSRDYQFFSQVHQVYSRINFFVVHHSKIETIVDTKIEPITLADHAHITISFTLDDHTKGEWQWRLNEFLLQDTGIKQDLIKELEFFFETSRSPEI